MKIRQILCDSVIVILSPFFFSFVKSFNTQEEHLG